MSSIHDPNFGSPEAIDAVLRRIDVLQGKAVAEYKAGHLTQVARAAEQIKLAGIELLDRTAAAIRLGQDMERRAQ